jgi:pyruvate kinase
MQTPNNINNTKILATLGPSSMKESIVQKMDSAGVDMFRINLSHTEIKDFTRIIGNIRKWTNKPICIDTEGAQVRIGKMKNNHAKIKNNSVVFLTSTKTLGNELHIPLYPIIPKDILRLGDILAIDFHSVVVQVIKIEKGKVYARVLSEGEIWSNKGVGIDRLINLPAFTKKDLKILRLSKEMDLSFFALSFAAKKEDIKQLRKFFPYSISVISKIESRLGLTNLEDICKASDAILIDRGDLSREVPLQKIGLIQRHILDVANKIGSPVYVATNLLENMVDNFEPTRAEINDITSTLLTGAKGLVLAAETAIGRYPIQSVRMVAGIKREVESYIESDNKSYFNSIYDYNLIEPHGGVLVQNFIESDKTGHFKEFPKIDMDDKVLSDIVQIAEGTYSPLRGFMNKDELFSVLENYKLPNGVIWTLPILLQLRKKDINFSRRDNVIIRRKRDKNFYALIKISDIEKINIFDVGKKWFGTDDIGHPGVSNFMKQGDYIVSGEVFLIQKPLFYSQSYVLTPKQTRQIFKDRGCQNIVGFHTRSVIHRGHEFIQKEALKSVEADALLISPVIGHEKETDFSAEAILKSYEVMLNNNYYAPYPALIGAFNTYSRYCGPGEAVFTALCKKNFGCSHFIVGRDHTGVGNYYSSDTTQKLFDQLGDIGIIPLMFDTAYFCKSCRKVTNHCRHKDGQKLKLSGTEVRNYLLSDLNPPEYLMRKEISKILQNMAHNPKSKLFETGCTRVVGQVGLGESGRAARSLAEHAEPFQIHSVGDNPEPNKASSDYRPSQ